jgi:hypothetical protein
MLCHLRVTLSRQALGPRCSATVVFYRVRFIGLRLPPEITWLGIDAQDKAIGGTNGLLVVPQTLNTAHTWHVDKFADRW